MADYVEHENAYIVELKYLRQWIHQNDKFIIINCAIICYMYGAWIFSRAPLVDTMLYINMPSSSYNWLSIEREGAVLSKWLFQSMNYNPYFATGVGYLFICVGGILLGYIGFRCSKEYGWIWTFTPFIFLSPVFAEQFYFKLQILELGWGYVLCASAVALNYFIIFKKKRWLYFFSVAMMIWSFHTYQTFVITYAVMVAVAYILMCLSGTVNEKRKDILWWSLLLEHIVLFGIANIIGKIITSTFFNSSGYLESTILWEKDSIGTCLKNINTHMKWIFLGNGENIFFTGLYGVLAFLVVILVLKDFLDSRRMHLFVMLLATIGIQISPLLITIYTGSIPSVRGQLIYPLVMIFNGLISFISVGRKKIKWKKFLQISILSIMIVTLWQQVAITMRLIYTNEVRADEDIRLAQNLDVRLIEMNAANKPVAFVGGFDNVLNPACVRGEVIGRSIFSMFTESKPHYVGSTWHACSVMNAMGINRKQANDAQIDYARRIAVNMPIWPARDSVLDMGDFVIVKLGVESWADEILSTDLISVDETQIEYTDDLTAAVEPLVYNGSEVIITGWCVREDLDSSDCIPKVCLKHNKSGQIYVLGTTAIKREELIQFFGSGHQNGGFMAKTDTKKLKESLNEYSVYVGYEENEQYHLMKVADSL